MGNGQSKKDHDSSVRRGRGSEGNVSMMVVYGLRNCDRKYGQMLSASQSRFTEPKGARLVKVNTEARPEIMGDLPSPAARFGYD